MIQGSNRPAAFLTLVLHAHLPYVVNHGTWPHGMEWLHEAAAETYLPLLRVLRNLERDQVPFHCNLNFSPVLLEQLAHPVFLAEFPKYLTRKIVAAGEDEAFFVQSGELHYAYLARFWSSFFSDALNDFNALGGNIIGGFRHFSETGMLSLITCCATHGYLPLLGTDESVRAQVRLAVETHERHFGSRPGGIWSPECGYRPAGLWTCPVPNADGSPAPAPFDRVGLEEVFSESGLNFFFVDTHLIQDSHGYAGAYAAQHPQSSSVLAQDEGETDDNSRLYKPWLVDGPYDKRHPVSILPRDPRTGLQVWSGDSGYPGDSVYLDFHKKRWPGGHRYWRVTGPRVSMEDKAPYQPEEASRKVLDHAAHFAHVVWSTLAESANTERPPVLCAPFDAELFGHWWFEGPQWLEAVARTLHEIGSKVALTSAVDYLERFPATEFVAMPEGSWGSGGRNEVWLNSETAWTWTHIYPAERYVREVATSRTWSESDVGRTIVQQLCRELLLLESSDWQFLITTGAARDYAEGRFFTHLDQFNELRSFWQAFSASGDLSPEQQTRLGEIGVRDGIFPDIDPGFWATGAREHFTTPPGIEVLPEGRPASIPHLSE